MTGSTLAPEQRRNLIFVSNLGQAQNRYESTRKDTGAASYVLEAQPVFRSGTFSDSNGVEHTWEALHMSQMVDHYTLLANRDIFSDVPIRKGHADWGGIFSGPVRNAMDELVGYMSNFKTEPRVNPTDGNTYEYFLADLEIIDEEAIKKVKSGLWRNLSAEIGGFTTNANAEYWPVMMGVAYVDIPAVEGLKSQHSKNPNSFSIILEESQMTQPGNGQPPLPTGPTPPAPTAFSIGGKSTTDHAAVQNHIKNLESENASLGQFRTEALAEARVAFVKGLVKDNKLAAPQEESYIEYVKGLDDATYAGFVKLQEGAAPMVVTQPHGAQFSNSVDQVTGNDAVGERKIALQGIISSHQLRGAKVEDIEKMPSYKELKTLDPAFSL